LLLSSWANRRWVTFFYHTSSVSLVRNVVRVNSRMKEYNWTQWLGTYFCERRVEPDEFDHEDQQRADEFQCLLDVSGAARDLIVAFVWVSILIYTCGAVKNVQRTCSFLRVHSTVVSRYSLHDLRWLLAFALFLTHLADLGDALLIWKSNPLQIVIVSLILPVCNALVVVLSCIYFDRIEVPILNQIWLLSRI
jgi:hypothetical protein